MRRNIKLGLNLALLAASLFAISGCNQGAGTEARTQGKGLAFKTAEPAPDGFDSWDFVWKGPKRALNSDLEELVLQPDGREYAKQEFAAYPGNSDSIHSSFSPGFAGGDPKVFWHQPIRVQFGVSKGTIVFAPADAKSFKFRFFKKDANGDVDWRKPFHTVDAVPDNP